MLYRIATDPWTHCDLIVWMLIRPNARNRRCYISIQRKTKIITWNCPKSAATITNSRKKPQKVLCATFFSSRKTKLMDEWEASLFIQNCDYFCTKVYFCYFFVTQSLMNHRRFLSVMFEIYTICLNPQKINSFLNFGSNSFYETLNPCVLTKGIRSGIYLGISI